MRRHSSVVVSKTRQAIAIKDMLGSKEVYDFSAQIIKATYCPTPMLLFSHYPIARQS